MRRVLASALIGLGLVAATPRPAQAQWFILKWLEELSPPGNFIVTGVHFTTLCVPKSTSDPAVNDAFAKRPIYVKGLFCDMDPVTWDKVGYFLGVDISHGHGDNPLTYPAGAQNYMTVTTYAATGAKRWNRKIDTGVSVGVVRFAGRKDFAFNKFVIDPYVSLRPFGDLSGWKGRILDVRFGMLVFPHGPTLDEFGASGGVTASQLTGGAEKAFHAEFSISFVR